jgi:murein DD-endopeptidase MepM/ murein hydrolase activator NlpD
MAVPSTFPAGAARIRAVSADGSITVETEITILAGNFLREVIPLNQANTDIRTVRDPKKTAEAEELWRIIARVDPSSLWTLERFQLPVESPRRTSAFGDRRLYRYTDGAEETSIHAGVDFGVPEGTPVRASARGKTLLARDRIVTGKSVILEHMPGVYSAYYHLSRIDVGEGSMVEAGALIGLSGSTGLSTGPHLHWEIRVSGEAADPDAFTSRRILDKESLIGKINESSAPQ